MGNNFASRLRQSLCTVQW